MNVVLLRTDERPAVDAWLEEGEKRLELGDDDQVEIQTRIGATNVHRGHNVSILPDGGVAGRAAADVVSNWSVGCQVFLRFEEFNLFLRLCAMSKRWRCGERPDWPPPPPPQGETQQLMAEARRLEGRAKKLEGDAAALVAQLQKEQAPDSARPGAAGRTRATKAQVDKAAAEAKAAREAATKADARAREAERADQALLGGCVQIRRGDAPKDSGVGGRQVAKLSALDPKKKADVIWNRTALFMHDWLRVCDLGGWCSVRFDYTLAELETARIEQIAQAFAPEDPGARKPNRKWDGKLTG